MHSWLIGAANRRRFSWKVCQCELGEAGSMTHTTKCNRIDSCSWMRQRNRQGQGEMRGQDTNVDGRLGWFMREKQCRKQGRVIARQSLLPARAQRLAHAKQLACHIGLTSNPPETPNPARPGLQILSQTPLPSRLERRWSSQLASCLAAHPMTAAKNPCSCPCSEFPSDLTPAAQ